jgi:hypothetical protein
LKAARPQDEAAIDALLADQQIDSITDAFGSGATNAGNPASVDVLPVYKTLSVGAPVQVCSDNDYGTGNKLGVRSFVRFTAGADGSYEFTATQTITVQNSDPDIVFFDQGFGAKADAITPNTETLTRTLMGGAEYVLSVYEFANTTPSSSIGRTCFSVSVVQR